MFFWHDWDLFYAHRLIFFFSHQYYKIDDILWNNVLESVRLHCFYGVR